MHNNDTLAGIGERAFIRRLRELLPGAGGDLVLAVGDDCAAIRTPTGGLLLGTTDTFVDGVHFKRPLIGWEDTGRRCMAASISDIAAMAGLPMYALISLSLPGTMTVAGAVDLARGLIEEGAAYGCPVAGGETTATPGPATVTVTVTGRVEPERMTTRAGSRSGDAIYVTGTVGDAMAGLLMLDAGARPSEATAKFTHPLARIEAARVLTGTFEVTAMIDVSDGIATDLGHICDESGCGAVIEAARLPVGEAVRTLAAEKGFDPVAFALSSGEEFELLFTVRGNVPDRSLAAGVPVTRIGIVTERSAGVRLVADGRAEPLESTGYEHFRI